MGVGVYPDTILSFFQVIKRHMIQIGLIVTFLMTSLILMPTSSYISNMHSVTLDINILKRLL